MAQQFPRPAAEAGPLTMRLADRAFEPRPADHAHLRALTLGNLAAGLGEMGSAAELIRVADERFRHTAGDRAYVSSMRLHARTQDDFSPAGRVHVGAITLAATLALADRAGDRLLESLAAGYDAMGVVALAYSPAAQAAGQRPSGMFGPFGAAASSAAALGLDRAGCANALGLAATMTGGTTQAWLSGTHEWLLEAGWAARAGVDAALLTESGVEASSDALEGDSGWCRAFFGDAEGSALTAAIDDAASRVAEVAAKPYPVSGIAQVATQLACEAHGSLDGDEPRRVEVRLAPPEVAYPGSANAGPFRGRFDALMSVAYCVACGLHEGTVALERLEHASDGELDALVARGSLVPEEALEEGQAVLLVERDGATIELAGKDEDVLFPSWEELSADVAGLARRTAADEPVVAACARALAEERPDARRLNEIWMEAVPWK